MAKKVGNLIELGTPGLRQYSGHINEEWLRRLQGDLGRRIFREMSDNDEIVGAILFAVEMLLRNVQWRIEPFDDSSEALEQAEFVESLMTDMSHTWEDFIAEALTMLPYGFSLHEIVYKRREGPDHKDATRRSSYNDGLIGWRKLPVRSQDTLNRWEFDEDGGVAGFHQDPPNGGPSVYIPIEKSLLFRTTSRKSNPEGRSVIRNAFLPWFYKTRVASYEAIGVERDLAGLPILYLPPDLMDADADADTKAQRAEYERIIQNVRNDEQAGIVLPSIYDENNNQLLKFELAGTGSRRLFDTGAIIERYNRGIAMTVLADFILLGHEKVGSFALSSDKTDLFATALGAWLKEISSVLNRHALTRLYQLNGWDASRTAKFVPGDLERVNLETFSSAIERLTNSGWLTPGAETDEDHVRELMDLPATPADRDELREGMEPDPVVPPSPPESGNPSAGADPDPDMPDEGNAPTDPEDPS